MNHLSLLPMFFLIFGVEHLKYIKIEKKTRILEGKMEDRQYYCELTGNLLQIIIMKGNVLYSLKGESHCAMQRL